MPFQFKIDTPNTALQTIQVVDAMEGRREARDLQKQSLQLRMQEAASKLDERQKARAKEGLEGMARVAGAARNAQEWDEGIRGLVAQGYKEFESELGKWSPDRAAFNLRKAQDAKTLFEISPEKRQAKVDDAVAIERATDPYKLRRAVASRPVTTNQIFMAGENEFEKKYRGGQAEDALEIGKAANTSRATVSRLQQLEGLMRDFETGKLAPAKATAAAWADALGLSPETMARIGLKPTDAINGQSIEAITGALMVSQIGAGGFPANNFSNPDREFLLTTIPQLSKTPGANIIVTQSMKAAAQRNIERERQWLAARKAGKNYDQFSEEWGKYVESTPLFPTIQDRAGYDRLPSKSVFVDPQGTVRVKP